MRIRFCSRVVLPMVLAASTATAQGAVISFSTPIPVPQDSFGVYINFATGATDFTGDLSAWDWNPFATGVPSAPIGFFWRGVEPRSMGVGEPASGYLDLSQGYTISSSSPFMFGIGNTQAFTPMGTHTLGFRFLNEATHSLNYGYAMLQVGGPGGFPLTVLGWSFEDSGGPITVTAIPEPATALMMTLGMLGLAGAARSRRPVG